MDGICPTPRLWLQLKGSRTSSKGPLAIIDQFGTPFCVCIYRYICDVHYSLAFVSNILLYSQGVGEPDFFPVHGGVDRSCRGYLP